jgi:hypothetical protein
MAVMTSVVWPKGRIRRFSLKIHPLGDITPPSLRRAVPERVDADNGIGSSVASLVN